MTNNSKSLDWTFDKDKMRKPGILWGTDSRVAKGWLSGTWPMTFPANNVIIDFFHHYFLFFFKPHPKLNAALSQPKLQLGLKWKWLNTTHGWFCTKQLRKKFGTSDFLYLISLWPFWPFSGSFLTNPWF